LWIGAHIGTSEGLAEAVRTARGIGCDAIQIFSKSPQSWKGPPIRPESAEEFRVAVKAERIRGTAIHHCYLTNLASSKPATLKASRAAFLDEIDRAELLGASQLIFHPGAHVGEGVDSGIARITEALNWALGERPEAKVRILLENAAGQGTTVGSTFEELARVLHGLELPARVGVTIDTCHLFASGVDFRTPEGYGSVKDRIRSTLGLRTVQAFHLNDCKAGLGSHLDRHENIGRGELGVAGFVPWLNDPTWAKTPGYLETPLGEDDYEAYVTDLKTLRGLIH
jgi:deoxyribonuclease-4